MPATTTKSSSWNTTTEDDNDWTREGDPIKRRKIQNRISKRRQRERIRLAKAKAKEAQAKQYDLLFNAPFQRSNSNLSSSLASSSSSHGTPAPAMRSWRSSPPTTMLPSDCPPHRETYDSNNFYHARPSCGLYIPSSSYLSDQSSASTTCSNQYWPEPPVIPKLITQNPGTPVHDHLSDRSRSPFKSPLIHRHSPLSTSTNVSWPMDIPGPQTTAEGGNDLRLQPCRLGTPVPTLPSSTGYSYSPIEVPYSQAKSLDTSSDERVENMMAYSQAVGYPSFDSAIDDYYSRVSPQA